VKPTLACGANAGAAAIASGTTINIVARARKSQYLDSRWLGFTGLRPEEMPLQGMYPETRGRSMKSERKRAFNNPFTQEIQSVSGYAGFSTAAEC
jgi:hypothetical protein